MQCRLLSLHRASVRSSARRACNPRPLTYQTARNFHPTRPQNSAQDPQTPVDPSVNNNPPELASNAETANEQGTDGPQNGVETEQKPFPAEKAPTKKEFSPYGSAVRRAMRNRKPVQERKTPTAVIPSWFREQNIEAWEDLNQLAETQVHGVAIGQFSPDVEELREGVSHGGKGSDDEGGTDAVPSGHRYVLSQEIWDELLASVNAGLTLPASRYADEPSATKAHLVLRYPGDGGILFLDAVVKKLAATLGANVVTLNAQDIAEMYGEQDQDIDGSSGPLSLLGFEVYHQSKRSSLRDEEDMTDEDEDVDNEDADLFSKRGKTVSMSRFSGDSPASILQQLFGGRSSVGVAKIFIPQGADRKTDLDRSEEARCYRLIDKLLAVSRQRRSGSAQPAANKAASENSTTDRTVAAAPSDLIIQIQDYKELFNSRGGTGFMTLLHQAVQDKRRDGHRIIIVGTVSSNETDSMNGKASVKALPLDYDRYSKTIVVTPAMNPEAVEKVFGEDSRRRILEINIRHLQQVLKTRLKEPKEAELNLLNNRSWSLDTATIRRSGLDSGCWPFDQIHRIVTIALGCAKGADNVDLRHIQQGIDLVEKSDKIKSDWYAQKSSRSMQPHNKSVPGKSRRLKLKGKINLYEEKLLSGVVDAESIHTTFADVHVPPETIEALKTLTSLSLLRPEEFTYGVLATDKIPGLLLYGPPGTGKTLLAKAVARESGATVLEVSGSDVYDMYVGEGEKNVRAIFTLAKKLSPCVVFIDEADAIFCSRTGGHNRPSHRELINQFLREWDGMDDLSAFIMVATNRPFDLDDAVLRRLPRRLLVDLPTEEARLAILKIHLKNEQLDPAVDLAELARRTPFYSGSDLKNLAVSAALACVREEHEKASRHEGDEPYKYPERRTLRKEHFEKALNEISASISEDMSSLSAIRKFDEKYGDRKGRRKRSAGWGFTHPNDAESIVETGRVRN
ncbi:hypothetical protein VTO42DRAFT_1178 [Malbranchea cinnamomea]